MNGKYLILASKSPRRKELLKSVGIKFKAIDHKYDENTADKSDAILYVENAALGKALSIGNLPKYNDKFILGVDTVVVCGDKILGKPKSVEEADANIR
ncbi:MAG TPA: Maf family protein, partial [Spirochaetota bacterium]|nr:Maf family protein [Spirochaetota bacterium]